MKTLITIALTAVVIISASCNKRNCYVCTIEYQKETDVQTECDITKSGIKELEAEWSRFAKSVDCKKQ